MVLTLPVACGFAFIGNDVATLIELRPALLLLIPLLGLLSAMAVAFYILASHHLKLGLFGLLGYVEPVLLVLVALLLGERIEQQEWLTYIPIWVAVLLLVIEGLLSLRKPARPLRD
jgi:chloramphenicol-sensitive protein RarD